MSNMTPERVIRRPIIMTEKGSVLRETQNKYTFEVAIGATKPEIRNAVETLFDVSVKDVTTLIMRGKTKRVGKESLKRQNWKKAVVTLGADDNIDFFEGA